MRLTLNYIRFLYKIVFYKNNNFLLKSTLINYFYLNFIIWNNLQHLNNLIYSNSYKKKLLFILLKKSFRHRYTWTLKKTKFIKIKFNFFKKSNFFTFKKIKPLNKIIKIKRISGLFKKRTNLRSVVLSKRAKLFRFFKKHKQFKRRFKFRKFYNYRVNNIDLSKRRKLIFFENRKIIRIFLKNKSLKKQRKLSSYLVNLLPKKSKHLLNLFEFGLNIILIRAHIFNNLKDANFFIKSGCVFVNGFSIFNVNEKISTSDLIKIVNKKFYYSFYKNSIDDSIFALKKLNWAFYKFKKKRRKNNFFPKVYHWIYNHNHFGFDIPYFMEVDYVNLTIFILQKPLNISLINYTSIRYLNFYLTRLYNWNYIV